MNKAITTILIAVLLSGCSSLKSKTEANAGAMAGVKMIQVEDKTSAVTLQATGASLIAELVDTALRGNGYQTCRAPCEADATATIHVTSYANRTSINIRHHTAVPVSVIAFNFQLRDKTGKVLMETESRKKSDMEQRELAAKMVEDLAQKIPATK